MAAGQGVAYDATETGDSTAAGKSGKNRFGPVGKAARRQAGKATGKAAGAAAGKAAGKNGEAKGWAAGKAAGKAAAQIAADEAPGGAGELQNASCKVPAVYQP